jgi:hypothetical protein
MHARLELHFSALPRFAHSDCPCCVVGCRSTVANNLDEKLGLSICDQHWNAACENSRSRVCGALQRARMIQSIWEDEERFAAAYGSGRYLKLCSMLLAASEGVDRAWGSLLKDVSSASPLQS